MNFFNLLGFKQKVNKNMQNMGDMEIWEAGDLEKLNKLNWIENRLGYR